MNTRVRVLERLVGERTRALETEQARAGAALAEVRVQSEALLDTVAQAEAQAARLLQMDARKSGFFANLSHEFRTPLTLVIDPLERALAGAFGPLEPALARRLETALGNARLTLRLINQLLDLSRIEAGQMTLRVQPLDLVPLLKRLVRLFDSEAERLGIMLLFTPGADAFPCVADREKLEQIVLNLISNALKATPSGGKVLVSVRLADDVEGGAAEVEVSVRDTGIGIPAEELPHVFDRFYRGFGPSSQRQAGTGIGLALARELAEMHGGTITAESVPGFGSVFAVRLPYRAPEVDAHTPAAPAEEPRSPSEVAGYVADIGRAVSRPLQTAQAAPAGEPGASDDTRPRVLLVDDNADVRALLREHLEAGYRIEEADNGLEGIRKARERRPDLIVSDLVMPEMEGLAFCRQVRLDDRLADVPVILLTADASERTILEGLEAGADDYLTKPFSASVLHSRVAALIRSRRALRSRFSREVVLQPTAVVATSADAALLQRVRETVELHLENPNFTVGMLAAEVGLSESQLKRRLGALVGEPPVALIRRFRLERAAQLLEQRVGNVGEVAFAVGFQNLPYFAKCFREQFGVPPSQYAGRPAGEPE